MFSLFPLNGTQNSIAASNPALYNITGAARRTAEVINDTDGLRELSEIKVIIHEVIIRINILPWD